MSPLISYRSVPFRSARFDRREWLRCQGVLTRNGIEESQTLSAHACICASSSTPNSRLPRPRARNGTRNVRPGASHEAQTIPQDYSCFGYQSSTRPLAAGFRDTSLGCGRYTLAMNGG